MQVKANLQTVSSTFLKQKEKKFKKGTVLAVMTIKNRQILLIKA